MECKSVQLQIDDYLDSYLDPFESEAMHRHIQYCSGCQSRLMREQQLRLSLRNMPIVLPPKQRFASLVRAAKAKHPATPWGEFGFGWVMVGAGGLAMVCLTLGIMLSAVVTEHFPFSNAPSVVLSVNDVKHVNLVFNAEEDLHDVTMSVELPSSYYLQGYKDTKNLTWQISLAKGQNVLTLPIVTHTAGSGTLIAKLNAGDKQKTFQIKLTSTDAEPT